MQLELDDNELKVAAKILRDRRRELLDEIEGAMHPNNGKRDVPSQRRELKRVESILRKLHGELR